MHGIVVDQHHVAGPPVVPLAVVHLVPVTFEDVEERLVLMPVVVRDPARRLGLDVDLERLRSEGLHGRTEHVLVPVSGPALPREVLRLDDARQGEPKLMRSERESVTAFGWSGTFCWFGKPG